MTSRRFIGYAALAAVLGIAGLIVALFAVDVALHQTSAAINVWGYRGPAIGSKTPGERRLAVIGESTAYGYGVQWNEAFPAYLEAEVNRRSQRPVTVVNLAYNNEGAYSYAFTLRDYAYLDYDAVLIYSGYNDLGGPNTSVFRHESAVFRMTGYMPLLPALFREKASAIRDRWKAREADAKTRFDPTITERATVAALEKAASISRTLEAQLDSPPPRTVTSKTSVAGTDCGERWAHYCGGMLIAVRAALAAAKPVLIVTQPYYNWEHREQQQHMVTVLREQFRNERRVRFADLGDAIDLRDRSLCYDGLHLTPEGNRRVARALIPDVQEFLK